MALPEPAATKNGGENGGLEISQHGDISTVFHGFSQDVSAGLGAPGPAVTVQSSTVPSAGAQPVSIAVTQAYGLSALTWAIWRRDAKHRVCMPMCVSPTGNPKLSGCLKQTP